MGAAREIMTLREAMDHLFDDAFTRPISLEEVRPKTITVKAK